MSKNLSINQVEKSTGVSKRNIRFYEKEELLFPKRNAENGYRVYDESDIWRLKVIKMLRMLDMPLEEIKGILEEKKPLGEAIAQHQMELEEKQKELQRAILFCEQMKEIELSGLDVDGCLTRMEDEKGDGFFKLWVDDYKRVVEANKYMDFTFEAERFIENEREFTDELLDYANRENLNLVITKESMSPEFTIDGMEYKAIRYYGRYSTVMVRCERKDREIKGEGIAEKRKLVQYIIHKYIWYLVLWGLVLLFGLSDLFKSGRLWEAVVIILGVFALFAVLIYRDVVRHYGEQVE